MNQSTPTHGNIAELSTKPTLKLQFVRLHY
jgi:hypothetical protein